MVLDLLSPPTRPLNLDLLRDVLDHLDTSPAGWRQDRWRRPDGMCFAAWTVELSGGRWLTAPDSEFAEEVLYDADIDGPCGFHSAHPSRALVTRMEVRAPAVLGIDYSRTLDLFRADKTLPELRELVDRMCAGGTR